MAFVADWSRLQTISLITFPRLRSVSFFRHKQFTPKNIANCVIIEPDTDRLKKIFPCIERVLPRTKIRRAKSCKPDDFRRLGQDEYQLAIISEEMIRDDPRALEQIQALIEAEVLPVTILAGDLRAQDMRRQYSSYLFDGFLCREFASAERLYNLIRGIQFHIYNQNNLIKYTEAPKVNNYSIDSIAGVGGMATVWRGIKPADGTQVAIKFMSKEQNEKPVSILRAKEEYRLLSRIESCNIVKLYEFDQNEDELYFTVMEYLPGNDLKQHMIDGITSSEAVIIFKQILQGLDAVHSFGIIHRDLKPGNVVFRNDDSLAIIDFGIARDIVRNQNITAPGQKMGTPAYMSPEQFAGGYRPDSRADLYAVGIILYEVLTGERPFVASTYEQLVDMHMHKPIPQLPHLYSDLQHVLDKLSAKVPGERFASASDVLSELNKSFRFDKAISFDSDLNYL
ncbi:MAG: serine/threonine protein kinase [Gammaproteobacteria bacterium]|nr:serine/threonine protein kinase [Gammaproteobacteria bacterium]